MNSNKKLKKQEAMGDEQFKEAIKFFFPDLHTVIQNMIDDGKKINFTVCDRYNIDGFNQDYVSGVELHGISGVRVTDYFYLVASWCKFYESNYYDDRNPVHYIDVFRYLSENKEKHMFWFL